MKVNKEKLKNEIEEIIAYGAAYSEEVDLTTTKVMSVIEPLVIAVTELSSESENERLKAEGEWIEIDPNVINQIPDEDVWTYWFKTGDIEFTPKGDYIPLGAVTHYMPLVKPQPPKQ